MAGGDWSSEAAEVWAKAGEQEGPVITKTWGNSLRGQQTFPEELCLRVQEKHSHLNQGWVKLQV